MRLRVTDEVTWDGASVPGERVRALLVALAEAGTRGSSVENLIDTLWWDEMPEHPSKALQVLISRARAATSAEVIERTQTGYRLALPKHEVDLWTTPPVMTGVRHHADELVGRDTDIEELVSLVNTHRLVSIVGPGGLGKTRIAHVVARQAEQPAVHFLELVSLTDDRMVATEIADALGAREANATRRSGLAAPALSRSDPILRIQALISDTPTLLILDNCEQIIDGVAAVVADLLARLPDLTVLTTSRAPLQVAGEHVVALPGLTPEEAGRLFRQRARAGRPGIKLDPLAVERIVSRLDGLPLAVELAASAARMMSLAEIERRLDDRFALLKAETRDVHDRHRTLLAVIDWSWQLLDDYERRGLRRLALCRDDVGLDVAAVVMGESEDDAFRTLHGLVDQSLVVLVDAGEVVRFRLLETVREFGLIKLNESGEFADTERRYFDWAISLAERRVGELFGASQIDAVRAIRREERSLLDVLRHALVRQDGTAIAATAGLLASLWTIEGAHLKFAEIGLPAADAVAVLDVDDKQADLLRGLLALSVITTRIFVGVAPPAVLARLSALGTDGVAAPLAAMVTISLAFADLSSGDAVARLEELANTGGADVAQLATMWISQFYENVGRVDDAWSVSVAAREQMGTTAGPWQEAMLDSHLAGLALTIGRPAEAREYALAALPTMTELEATDDRAQLLGILAFVAIAERDFDAASGYLDELCADDLSRADLGGAFSRFGAEAELLLARGDIEAGLSAYRHLIDTIANRRSTASFAVGVEPWLLLPAAAALMAHVRAGDRAVAGDRDALRERVSGLVVRMRDLPEDQVDVPVLAAAEIALACWELQYGDTARGRELLASGFSQHPNQLLPSIDLAWARSLVE